MLVMHVFIYFALCFNKCMCFIYLSRIRASAFYTKVKVRVLISRWLRMRILYKKIKVHVLIYLAHCACVFYMRDIIVFISFCLFLSFLPLLQFISIFAIRGSLARSSVRVREWDGFDLSSIVLIANYISIFAIRGSLARSSVRVREWDCWYSWSLDGC
jgi:hypothetical protein